MGGVGAEGGQTHRYVLGAVVAALLAAHQLAARGFGSLLIRWLGVTAFIGTLTGLAQAYGLQLPIFATTRLPGGSYGNRAMAWWPGSTPS